MSRQIEKKWSNKIVRMKKVRAMLCIQKSLKVALSDLTEEDFDVIIAGLDDAIKHTEIVETGRLKVVKIEDLK